MDKLHSDRAILIMNDLDQAIEMIEDMSESYMGMEDLAELLTKIQTRLAKLIRRLEDSENV